MALVAPVLWAPQADEGDVRAAADLWRGFAVQLECTVDDLGAAVTLVTDGHEGQTVDAFGRYWLGLAGPQHRNLHDLVAACRSIAAALDAYADALVEVRRQLVELGASIAASVAVGAALAWATAGVSAATTGGTVAALTLEAASLSATLATRAAAIAKIVSLHASVGALEGLATYAIVEPLMVVSFRRDQDPFGAYTWEGLARAAATGAVLPGWRGLRALRRDLTTPGAGAQVTVAARPRDGWDDPAGRSRLVRDLAANLGVEVGVATWDRAAAAPTPPAAPGEAAALRTAPGRS